MVSRAKIAQKVSQHEEAKTALKSNQNRFRICLKLFWIFEHLGEGQKLRVPGHVMVTGRSGGP